MATEISVRMRYVLSGVVTEDNAREKEMPALSPYILLGEHFNALHDLGESKLPRFDSYSMMKKQILALHLAEIPDFSSSDAMHSMIDLIVTKGIYDLRYRRPFRVQAVERVENDFESISTALANGYPLIANMIPGNFFGYQEHWEVYRAPYNAITCPEHGVAGHCIVLVGARRNVEVDYYYYFVNSCGKTFCRRFKNGEFVTGGIGKLHASDIINLPCKLLRCVVDEEN